jgi:two-component system OmpR family sensor kinase
MIAPKSLQWRLSLWLGLGIALVWAVAAAVTAQNLRHQMDEVFDSALRKPGSVCCHWRCATSSGATATTRPARASRQCASMTSTSPMSCGTPKDNAAALAQSRPGDLSAVQRHGLLRYADPPSLFDAALQGTITITVAEPQPAAALARRCSSAWPARSP